MWPKALHTGGRVHVLMQGHSDSSHPPKPLTTRSRAGRLGAASGLQCVGAVRVHEGKNLQHKQRAAHVGVWLPREHVRSRQAETGLWERTRSLGRRRPAGTHHRLSPPHDGEPRLHPGSRSAALSSSQPSAAADTAPSSTLGRSMDGTDRPSWTHAALRP